MSWRARPVWSGAAVRLLTAFTSGKLWHVGLAQTCLPLLLLQWGVEAAWVVVLACERVLAPALGEVPRNKTVRERKAGFPRRDCKKVLSALRRLSSMRVSAWGTPGFAPALFWLELGVCLCFVSFPQASKRSRFQI